MKTKKLLLIGAIALVVIGCILVAGCTSDSQSGTPTIEDQISGIWINGENTFCYIMDANKTGIYYKLENGTLTDKVAVAWIQNDDGTYAIIKGEEKTTVTLDPVKGQFTSSSGSVFEKQTANTSGHTPTLDELYQFELDNPDKVFSPFRSHHNSRKNLRNR